MKVAVALSGGVDSSAAALLLLEQGHQVVGITLQQWPLGEAGNPAAHGGCCSLSAVEDARRVCGILDVPYYVWNMEQEFGQRVIEPFHQAYQSGLTPNPCLSCNSLVRFDLMLKRVLELGFDALATGHYAQVLSGEKGEPELHCGLDPEKDQSYFLYHLDRERLRRILFPVGGLTKPEVRKIAARAGLPVAKKPESMDICFISRGRTADYLARRLPVMPIGEVVDGEGRQLGRHRGIAFYTVGQREGLGQLSEPGPWYVVSIDAAANRLVVGRKEELAQRQISLEKVSFIGDVPSASLACEARLRYRTKPLNATYCSEQLELAEPFYAVAPGQAAVFYQGTRVLGGGIVKAA